MTRHRIQSTIALSAAVFTLMGLAQCGSIPEKKYYLLNYLPAPSTNRLHSEPYPCILRVKEMDIETAYERPQIVYRHSAFELQYDYYRSWAVKPAQMITDLIFKHLQTSGLVGVVVRRFDEGVKPDFEISGTIEALEEYDSDKAWFAHVALRLELTRLKDGRIIYSRRFDHRKQVYQNQPDLVIKEMSAVVEFIMNMAIRDMDTILSHEAGYTRTVVPPVPMLDTTAASADPVRTEGSYGPK